MDGSSLTPRQREVLSLLARGYSNREIAVELGISVATAKTHVERVLRALDVTNRTEAVWRARARFDERPAIAVLRFDVDAEVPLAQTFAAGLEDDLVTLLCRWCWFPVIARSTSRHYGSEQPAAKVGELTGAAYVISGAVTTQHADRLRVVVRLDDTRREWCLWSDRFELALRQVFELRDELAALIVARAYPELFEAEGRRSHARPCEELSAWQLAHAALLRMDRGLRDETQRAIELFEHAAARDRQFVLPLYGKGMALFDQVINQWTDRVDEGCREIERCAERAIEADERDASGWVLAGRAALVVGDARRAISPLERAVELNPSHARAHSFLGQALIFEGDRRGFEVLELAARLSPRAFTAAIPFAHFAVGEYDRAATVLREEIVRQPENVYRYALLCASLALAGDLPAAKGTLSRMLELEPAFCLANYFRMIPRGRHDVYDRIAEGLHRAGLAG